MANGYPTGPCKDQYNRGILYQANLDYMKKLADSSGAQIEVTFRPDEIRFNFIRKDPNTKNVKREQITLKNEDIAERFNENLLVSTLYRVCSNI